MNTFVASPDLAQTIARQQIADRVAQAEHSTATRAARTARRTARRETERLSARPKQQFQLPWWAFRFTRPAH